MKDSLIVVSGGMDSITLLYEYADRIALAVSFDYGANHNHKEIPFARIHCERLKIKHIVIKGYILKKYYPSREYRSMSDIDIFIDLSDREKVYKIINVKSLPVKAGFVHLFQFYRFVFPETLAYNKT